MYTVPLIYRISSEFGSVSINRLRRALRAVIMKHQVLRTALNFDENGSIVQRIAQIESSCNEKDFYKFTIIYMDDETIDQNSTIYRALYDRSMFDIEMGHVFHVYIIYHAKRDSEVEDILTFKDMVIFSIHHSVFDGASIPILVRELSLSYNLDGVLKIDDNALQYIDYATHEHELDMSTSRDFWRQQLDGYDFERRLTLPFDRQRLPVEQRSGQASVIEFTFDDHLSHSFINYASAHQLTLFQLGLATFFAFLFKLTNGETDLCIAGINANRYRTELQDLIGMFVATLPYRTQLDPHASFEQLTKQVREQCLLILEHSHYPLQHILADAHYQQSNIAFLETVFDFITLTPDMNRLTLGEAELETVSIPSKYNVAKFDFMLTMLYDPTADNNSISCSLICSSDVFHQNTVDIIGKRFSTIFTQLFDPMQLSIINKPLYKLSILLPDELRIVQELNYIDNNQQMKEIQTINELFCQQVLSHPQKVAVELDEQCLTYNELLFIVQRLSVYLLNEFDLKPGEIVCQCIERSISMVSSSMNIFLCEVTISVRLFSLLIR